MDFDYIIVGGGSAGCVLASRLSECSRNRVLLCEAGRDTPPGDEPEDILDSYPGLAFLNKDYVWGNTTASMRPQPLGGASQRYEQARIMGGGSSINGQLANRGLPSDYDRWEELGATGWNWSTVLPYFIKCERDYDFNDSDHGNAGPLPVTRLPRERWSGHAKAFARAFGQAGYAQLADQNSDFGDGYYPLPISNDGNRRISVAMAYLGPEARSRPNLTIAPATTVTELMFEGPRCSGVAVLTDGREQKFTGREVILSSGALHTPAHLLRAGIGPSADLGALGITIRVDLPGVGRGLLEHPLLGIGSYIVPEARINGLTRRHHQFGARFSSGMEGMPRGDLSAFVTSKTAWHAVGDRLGLSLVMLNKVFSKGGSVRLTARDFAAPLDVEFGLLSDDRDVSRMKEGVRFLASLQLSAPVGAVCRDPFPAAYSARIRRLGRPTRRNGILADIASMFLDGPAWVRRAMMSRVIAEGPTLKELLFDDAALETFVRHKVGGSWHPAATCRMGALHDPWAVTDEKGQVRKVPGLRVVDASIFPDIPSANLNLPVVMMAERIAALIRDEAGQF